ncbi:MAG: DUF4347 domain-containing protein [Microcoleus anatoxicus]
MPNLNSKVSLSAIAFIDSKVKDYQSLIAGVKPGTEVVVLDGQKDAIAQITQILACRTNIDSIHIVSHGAPGSLQLGKTRFSEANLETYSEQLQQWRSAFTDNADILIYGCNVASGPRVYPRVRRGINSPSHSGSRFQPTGNNSFIQSSLDDLCYETGVSTPGGTGEQARNLDVDLDLYLDGFTFIQRIAELTNTNVAASKNLTGSATKCGDWELETRTGEIKTPLVFREDAIATYNHVLSSFSAATNFPMALDPFVPSVDYNGDGIFDLVIGGGVFLANGNGSFKQPISFPGGPTKLGNFNSDNILDLATANLAFSGIVSIRPGNGTGGFGTPTNFNVGNTPMSIASGNFNPDTFPDLAVVNANPQGTGSVSILLGNGTGGFSAATNFNVGGIPASVAVGNFNADNFPDLAVGNSLSNNISILLGNGTGGFGAATNFGTGQAPNSIIVADFNVDGNLDLATANNGSNNVSILLGNGTGGFTNATNFNAGLGANSVAAFDLNGDNKLDLAVSNYKSTNLSILLGNGTGGFSQPIDFALTGTYPGRVTVNDFNNDSLPDLAVMVTNGSSDNVSILLNTPNTVNFGAATYSATEGSSDTVVNIPVTISGTPLGDVVVPIVINPSSSATQNSDYTISPTSITFPAGATGAALTKNVAVTIKPDNLPENAETAIFNFGTITGGVAGTTKQTTLTIAANDQPSTLSPYKIDLKTGAITGQPNPFISLVNTPADSNADSWLEAVAKINFDGNVKKAKFIVEYDKAPSGWTVNLGDSASNDGYGGDSGDQSRDAEVQIVNGSMAVFGNDYNTPPGGELPPGNVPNFVSNGSRIELEVSNEQLAWDNKNGLKNSLNSPYLYALNGQADNGGPVNSEIYAGFNRVISGPFDRIGSGASKVTILLNPIDYAVSAGTATLTEGNSGKTGVTFTVTRSGSTEFASKIDYAIAGTATNVSDYNNIGGTSAATGIAGTINFTAGETSKTITLDVLGDTIVEPDETITVTLSSPAGAGVTPTITTATATTTITNDDKVGVTVSPITGLTTSELGGKATFTVKLNSQPSANVTFGLSSDNVAEGTVSPNSLTFTPADYSQPKTVTVTGVDDLVADGNKNYKIVTAAAASTDANYNNFNPDDVTATNSDNETAGITVNPITGLTTSEVGGKATFTVKLNSQPTANVTFGLSSDNVAEGTVAPASLTFTPANYSQLQTVTVTGIDDFKVDGKVAYKIVTAAAVSTDANYNNLNPSDVTVTNTDNDTPGITIKPTGLTTSEVGGKATFAVKLNSQPSANVTFGLSSDNVAEGTVSTNSLTFTSANWNQEQTVTVTGVDDFKVDGNVAYKIVTAAAVSTDANYNNLNPLDVTATNSDNETAGITVNPTAGLTTGEDGTKANFTVVLNTKPTANVTVGLSSDNVKEGTVAPASLVFTPANWNTAQPVTVTGVEDSITDGDVDYKVVTAAAVSRAYHFYTR